MFPDVFSPTSKTIRAAIDAGSGPEIVLLSAKASVRKMAEAMMALANAHGGLIIVGIGAGRKILGVSDADEALERMETAGMLVAPPLFQVQPELVEIDGRLLCVAQIPAGQQQVYNLRGRYLVRSGRTNRPLTSEELRRLLADRVGASFERQIVADATLDDLDADAIQIYRDLMGVSSSADVNELLLDRGCLAVTDAGLRPTVAGLLLFGRQPGRWLSNTGITVVRYAGATISDDFVRRDIDGALPDQIRLAEAFVQSNMRHGVRLADTDRSEIAEYPQAVIREAIVNAVAHRDYGIRGDSIHVFMFSDRMEVQSPGRLPGPVTPDTLAVDRYSRNPIIVRVLTDLGIMQGLGHGIDRMIAACEQEGLPVPGFTETRFGFQVTIASHAPELVGAAPPPNLYPHLQLTPRQEKALDFLRSHRRITTRDLQTLCPEASPNTLRRDLTDLVDKGLLLKIGQKRATYYILK